MWKIELMKTIIKEIEDLNLSQYNGQYYCDLAKKIVSILQSMKDKGIKIVHHYVTLPKNNFLYRCVTPLDTLNSYTKEFLRYNDKANYWQRASQPHEPLFYGAWVNDNTIVAENEQHKKNAGDICMKETSTLYRDFTNGIYNNGLNQKIFSKWETNRDLNLITIVHPKVFTSYQENALLNSLKDNYKHFISSLKLSQSQTKELDEFTQFLAKKLAEPVIDERKYVVTALLLRQLLLDAKESGEKIDGFLYPSVRTDGEFGMCVALFKDVVDDSLSLINYYDIFLYMYKKKYFIANENTPEDEVCQVLGCNSIDDVTSTIEDS